MLALALLAQVFLPLYSLNATCVNGSSGDYLYLYDPVVSGHGDWTYSNLPLDNTPTKAPDGTWFTAAVGVSSTTPAKHSIVLGFNRTNVVTGKLEAFRQESGAWVLYATHNFTNYSGAFGTDMFRYSDCYNGYKIVMTITGCPIQPYIERWSNN